MKLSPALFINQELPDKPFTVKVNIYIALYGKQLAELMQNKSLQLTDGPLLCLKEDGEIFIEEGEINPSK